MIYYFIPPPLLLIFHMYQKAPGLTKYTFQQGSLPYHKEISVQAGEITFYISYCTMWMTIQCDLQWSLILYLPIQYLTWWLHLFWLLYTEKNNAKRGIREGDRKKFRNFKHKGNHKIGFYPKYLVIVTAYQVQGWWTNITNPVKHQPDGNNVEDILLNRSGNTHLNFPSHTHLLYKN